MRIILLGYSADTIALLLPLYGPVPKPLRQLRLIISKLEVLDLAGVPGRLEIYGTLQLEAKADLDRLSQTLTWAFYVLWRLIHAPGAALTRNVGIRAGVELVG